MKKILTILLILPLILFCGFFKRENKPYIILSSGTISSEYTKRIEKNFNVGQRINYVLVAPDGFKKSGVRLQISKQDDKTTNWGFSLIQSNDLYLNKGDKQYRDYIIVRNAGRYTLQFFYLSNKDYPFAHTEFRVY